MMSGMNGCSTVATTRSVSASTRSTAAIRGRVGLAQRPGRLPVDIAVGGADHLPNLLQRLVEGLPVQPVAQRVRQRLGGGEQRRVVLGRGPPARQLAVAVARDQRQRALRQVAEVVRQLDVDPR